MKQEEVVVYWAPVFNGTNAVNWNMLYSEPENVFTSLKEERNKNAQSDSFFYCPSFKNLLSNTFVVKNVLGSEYDVDGGVLEPHGDTYLHAQINRESSIEASPLLRISMSWIFFAEESLDIEITPPYFHPSAHSSAGAIVPGTFDIGQWFRPINAEFSLWKGATEFKLPEGDPIFYAKFNTEKKVVLKRFQMSDTLYQISNACVQSPATFGRFLGLSAKYNLFSKTKTNNLVLKNIKDNLIN